MKNYKPSLVDIQVEELLNTKRSQFQPPVYHVYNETGFLFFASLWLQNQVETDEGTVIVWIFVLSDSNENDNKEFMSSKLNLSHPTVSVTYERSRREFLVKFTSRACLLAGVCNKCSQTLFLKSIRNSGMWSKLEEYINKWPLDTDLPILSQSKLSDRFQYTREGYKLEYDVYLFKVQVPK